jgi:hypothetical protein
MNLCDVTYIIFIVVDSSNGIFLLPDPLQYVLNRIKTKEQWVLIALCTSLQRT